MKEVVCTGACIIMKKKYSLDYSIEKDIDRLEAVRAILDSLETNPSNLELEQMASYILYGKDENGKNSVQRGETTDTNKRYGTFKKTSDKLQSLDEILENPMTDQTNLQSLEKRYIYTKKKPVINRPKYDKAGNLIDIGDADVPGMQELWERIDYLERVVAANEGKIPFDDTMTILPNSYRLYQLKHQLIDMRRHQYYLKDVVKPTLHFLALTPPRPQTINFDSDSFYWISQEEWEKRVTTSLLPISKDLKDYEVREDGMVKWIVRHQYFDWENPRHVSALIDNYSGILMQNWDNLHSWGRTLIFDFDRYTSLINLSPLREYILTRKIDKASYADIIKEIEENFHLTYNINHISNILNREIPEKISNCAKKQRLLFETPQSERKQCFRCKRWFPKHTLFFGINNGRKDGYASNCKECEKLRRISKGGQTEYDRRSKDTSMLKMQTRETNS